MSGIPFLCTGLPASLTVSGKRVPLRTDFRVGLLATALLGDKSIPDGVAAESFLHLFCENDGGVEPSLLLPAVWRFYSREAGGSFYEGRLADGTKALDFAQDEGRLVSSFRQAYGMDLYAVRLHWWHFLALLTELPADTPLMTALRLRTMDPSSALDEETRYRLRMARRAVCLTISKNRSEESYGI